VQYRKQWICQKFGFIVTGGWLQIFVITDWTEDYTKHAGIFMPCSTVAVCCNV
jgi:hypothetical protein